MSIKTVDNNLLHLWPPFREKLMRVLEETSEKTGQAWFMAEGYRSPERQLYLWAQGRTRPGPIITWMKTPKRHGAGIAADCYPRVKNLNAAPMSWFRTYREIYQRHGLANGAWGKGDLGHVELLDEAQRQKALVWVRAGFPSGEALSTHSAVRVYVNGHEVEDAQATLREGRVWLALRPVADALEWTIADVQGGKALLVDDEQELEIPVDVAQGRGFVQARSLEPILTKLQWVDSTKKLFIVD